MEEEIIYSSSDIQKRIIELAEQINEDYKDTKTPIMAVCLLKGAVLFYSDLVRYIKVPIMFDFMAVSSYGNAEESSGKLTISKDLDYDVVGKDVVLIDDIVDSGATMHELVCLLKRRQPRSIKICCLIDKPSRRKFNNIVPDYVGFTIPNWFIYGFGLDNGQMSRNLPYIAIKTK